MKFVPNPRSRPTAIRKSMVAVDAGYLPERLTMQEEVKLTVEFLFAANGLEFVFDRLGIGHYLDQELDVMEDVELMAVHEAVLEVQEAART